MGHPVKIFTALLLGISFSFTSCEDLDISGMFRSYDLVNERFEQSMEWNAGHPYREIQIPVDDYTILSMGDSHVGPTKNLDTFFRDANTKNAAAVVLVGDLTTGQAEDYEIFQQHVPDPDSLTSFYLVGNHDLYFNGWNQFFPRFGSSVYYFTVKTGVDSDLFICLDTGGGTLGKKQLDWLKDILQNVRPDYRNCLVFTHNNFFRFRHTSSTNPQMEEIRVLINLFTKNKVDMVVMAHDHIHDVQLYGNTIYITMDALKDDLKNPGYFQIEIKNGQIEYRFINL
jgi:predicted phosphodiesterase